MRKGYSQDDRNARLETQGIAPMVLGEREEYQTITARWAMWDAGRRAKKPIAALCEQF
jgi:hypothetical protein